MPVWLPKILVRIHDLVKQRKVHITLKAQRESASLGLDLTDVCEILAQLTGNDSTGRLRSASTNEWMYIFKPNIMTIVLYMKLILRNNCVIVSLHEDEEIEHEAHE
jgi:hypothetical protein